MKPSGEGGETAPVSRLFTVLLAQQPLTLVLGVLLLAAASQRPLAAVEEQRGGL